MKSLILVGGGGHCRSCIDVITQAGGFRIVGIFDREENLGQSCLGIPVVGTDEDLGVWKSKVEFALVTVGQIRTPEVRTRLYLRLKELGYQLPRLVSPLAHVSSFASIGEGTLVMHQAIVNAGAQVGANCILNTKSLIEHDVKVGDHCHVATGAILNGGVEVGEGTFVGSGSVIREQIKVGRRCIVAMGSLVFKNIADESTFNVKPSSRNC